MVPVPTTCTMFFFVILGESSSQKSGADSSRSNLTVAARRSTLVDMAKTEEKTERELTSAEIIRELRGPLPEDDPDMVLENGQYEPRRKAVVSPEHREAVQAVLRDLRALPKGTPNCWTSRSSPATAASPVPPATPPASSTSTRIPAPWRRSLKPARS